MLKSVLCRCRVILLWSLLVSDTSSFAYASTVDHERLESITLSSTSLSQSLELIVEKFGVGYVTSPSLIKGVMSPAISGRFTLETAMKHVLDGTGLTFSITRSGVVIRKSESVIDETVIEEINVNGIRGSLNLSRQEKRNEKQVTDVIVAQEISRYPDRNLAESMQRIPGMSITREAGEGRQVVLRGLDPDLTLVTINGMPVLSNNDSPMDSRTQRDRDRSFDLNLFTSELFSQIKVFKSYSVEQPSGGVAGIAAITTAKPFDSPGLQWNVSHQVDANQYAEGLSKRSSFTLSSTNKYWGMLISAAYGRRSYQEQGANTFRWRRLAPEGANVSALDSELVEAWQNQEIRVPRGNRYSVWRGDMDRLGIGATLEYQTDLSHFTIDWIYGRLDSQRQENHLYPRGFQSTPTIEGETLITEAEVNSKHELVYADYRNARVGTESRHQEVSTQFKQAVLNFEHRMSNNFLFDGVLGVQSATYKMPHSIRAYMRGESDVSIDYRDDYYFPSIKYSAELTHPDMWQMNELDSEQFISTSDFTYLKGQLQVNTSHRSAWELGFEIVQFENTSKYTDIQNILKERWLSTREAVPQSTAYVFDSHQHLNWLALRPEQVYSFYNKPSSVDSLSLSYAPDRVIDNVIKESRTSFFTQYSVEGSDWTFNAGLRAERDKSFISVFQSSLSNRYNLSNIALLPSMQFNYRRDEQVVKVGISRTLGHQELDTLTRNIQLIDDENIVILPNDRLKPISAYNLDLSFESYPGEIDRYSANVFGKWIKNSIAPMSQRLPLSDVARDYPELFSSDFESVYIDVVTPTNQGTYFLYGVEGSVQLEWPLGEYMSRFNVLHVGIVANASYTFGNVQYYNTNTGDRLDKKAAPYLSPLLANLTAYLEGYALSLRLSATYRDEYIARVDGGTLVDENETGFLSTLYMDAVIAYQITDNVELRIEATNLTDEREIQYSDSSYRPYNTTVSGRNYSLAISYRY
ncbi:TonB-dependent receptor [Alteromonas sp. BMJM2]|uniref:TonB-dependent receptor n=1 Tax=Alteromonas sp. BMJM2 TaxID=2954241 RepID=UPI0022B366AF|nr:TonB-dependent receptor [Alteromonas sp. BMJM2]